MAEFTYPADQNVPYGQAALLENEGAPCAFNCNRGGGITHTNGSGLVSVRGKRAYRCQFSCNIALAIGATVGQIAVALAVNGEVLPDTIAVATPAAVGDYWNVSSFKIVEVPCGCCETVSIENVSPAGEATANPEIVIRNLNLEVNPV